MKTFSRLLNKEPIKLDLSILFLRVLIGSLMILHGIGKLQDLLKGRTDFFDQFDPFGIGGLAMLVFAVAAEFVCSVLVIIGFYARFAIVPMIITMGVAFFVFHADHHIMDKELPLIYLGSFVFLFLTGSGKYSLDIWIRNLGN